MDKLQELLSRCKCGVYLTVNQHRDYYETAEESLFEMDGLECPPEIEPETRKVMIEKDTIIILQFYPDTPIGSYDVYHYEIEKALDEALDILNNK